MTFIERVTGSDINQKFEEFELRLSKLPDDYLVAWNKIYKHVSYYSDFTGRNILIILEQVLEMMEEMSSLGKTANEIFGGNIDAFCQELTTGMSLNSVRNKWRKKLNNNIHRKLK